MQTHPGTSIEVAKEQPKISCFMEVPSSSLGSWELLKIYWDRKKRSGETTNEQCLAKPRNTCNHDEVSTACIMKMARAKFLQQASWNSNFFYTPKDFSIDYPDLSSEDMQDVELALLLQACAEKAAHQEFDRAQRLLKMCGCGASQTGNSVERVVFYFGEALKEKIDRDMGLLSSKNASAYQLDPETIFRVHLEALIALQDNLPFFPIARFTGIQSVLDNVASDKKIHLIDLGVRSGSHYTILLQALAERKECPVEFLKITAVRTSRPNLEWVGEQLLSFARDKVPFQVSFKAVESDIAELTRDLFEVESEEVVVIYSNFALCSLLASPNHIDTCLSVIKSLNPRLMVVIEAEVNTSHSTFLDRFNEYLIFASTMFDSFQTCLGIEEEARKVIEGVIMRETIRNVVVAEGGERYYHSETIDLWKTQFTRFGLVEADFSPLSLYQASLILKKSSNWMHCNLETRGKGLIINWKGVPVWSLSAWKFEDLPQPSDLSVF